MFTTRMTRSVVFIFLLVLVFAPCLVSGAQVGLRLQEAMDDAATDSTIPIILRMTEQVDSAAYKHLSKKERRSQLVRELRAKSRNSQKELRELLKRVGVPQVKDLWHINALAFNANHDLINVLANRAEVASVSLDRLVALPPAQLAAVAGAEWNLAAVGVFDLWPLLPGPPGDGMVVATIDSGVAAHPALQNYRGGDYDWFDPSDPTNIADLPFDTVGHGTKVMGLIAGSNESGSAIGVAPSVQWIAANPFNAMTTSLSSLHSSFAWALNPDLDANTDDAPDVVNNSWALDAEDVCSLEFQADINRLKSVGIAVVFAAGNPESFPPNSMSPGNNPNVLAVGATAQQNEIATFSARGPSACDGGVFPKVVAPGVAVITTSATGGYEAGSGTSFSAPHVAGVLVLLIQAFPEATISEVESALKYTARDLGPVGPDPDYGYGLVDAVMSYRFLDGEPILRSPADQAVGVAIPVVFSWAQRYDLPTTLLISESMDFSQTDPIVVSSVLSANGDAFRLAGCGLIFGAVFIRTRYLRLLLLLLSSFFILSCGGDSGGDSLSVVPDRALMSHTVSGLNPATTYYWQVQTTDSIGGVKSSAVHSFTTL